MEPIMTSSRASAATVNGQMPHCEESYRPSVSWVLCTNRYDIQTAAAIKSCLDQTLTDFELIFVANGANHSSIVTSAISEFGNDERLVCIETPISHLPFSLNLGVHAAKSELIARMDSDDISKHHRLEVQYEFMSRNPDVAVLGSNYDEIDPSGNKLRTSKLPKSNSKIRQELYWRNPICHPATMIRRNKLLAQGGYMGAGFHAEDYDLWTRISADQSAQFHNLDDALLMYRTAGVSVARRARLAYTSMAASQLQKFAGGFGWKWLLAFFWSNFKAIARGRK